MENRDYYKFLGYSYTILSYHKVGIIIRYLSVSELYYRWRYNGEEYERIEGSKDKNN